MLAGRLGVIGAATVVTVTAAVAVSGVWYPPQQWLAYAGANLLIALTYAMIGVLVRPLTGRLGGLHLILLLAFVDVGLGQTVVFHRRTGAAHRTRDRPGQGSPSDPGRAVAGATMWATSSIVIWRGRPPAH